LGYGGGFYDRTLNQLLSNKGDAISIGVAFKFQKCQKLPTEEYDISLNSILNEDGIYHFEKLKKVYK
jgi:5-formyltetrahydrofolate cyclo-ligase